MNFFKNKLTKIIIILSLIFIGIIVYTFNKEKKTFIESTLGNSLNPFQSFIYSGTNKVKETLDIILNFSEVKKENSELRIHTQELENKLSAYADLKDENDRLRNILNFTEERDNYNYIGCDIIHYSGGSFLDGYVVNKGENYNIKKGMIVISDQGLVGQVTSVADNWSIVQCILNENIAVSVMDESTRDNGYLTGYKNNKNEKLAQIYEIPLDSQIKEGDVILTSGVGLIYPKEIRVGEVISINEDNVKLMKNVIVKPYVDFNKLEELFIVAPKDTRNIKYN